MIENFRSQSFHLLVEYRLHKWHAATTARTSLGTRLDITNTFTCSILDGIGDVTFSDIVARAYLSIVGTEECQIKDPLPNVEADLQVISIVIVAFLSSQN